MNSPLLRCGSRLITTGGWRRRPFRWILSFTTAISSISAFVIAAWHYPYATDDPIRPEDAIKAFYQMTYDATDASGEYARIAKAAREAADVKGGIQQFIHGFRLQNARVLDVGSGSGYLQDSVEDYTGIDISSAAAKYYHKTFVPGTATAMPFADDEFDVAWSIWVIEHIPNPEAALREIRRVVRPGGLLFLQPAWDCPPWAAQGYEVRAYKDLTVAGRLIKASIPLRKTHAFWFVKTVPNRVVRAMTATRPSRLHYRRLDPNYTEYWQADSDAVNSLDSVEMAMWFESRGDECLNCSSGLRRYVQADLPLIIRVGRKQR